MAIAPLHICIAGKQLAKYDLARTLLVDHFLIRFTPTEFHLLSAFLLGEILTDETLIKMYLGGGRLDRWSKSNLDKHVDNIRTKIRPTGLSIYRVVRIGYVLRNSSEENFF